MKSWIFASLAASIISLIGISCRLLSPYAIFSRMDILKRTGSCETIPTDTQIKIKKNEVYYVVYILCDRYHWRLRLRTSFESTNYTMKINENEEKTPKRTLTTLPIFGS